MVVRVGQALMVVALLALAGCGDTDDGPPLALGGLSFAVDSVLLARLPTGATAEDLRRGEQLYRTCSVCHGLKGEGTQLGPSLSDTVWIHIGGEVDEIAEIIRAGIASPRMYPIPMPPMGVDDLSDDDLEALSIYVRARSLAGG